MAISEQQCRKRKTRASEDIRSSLTKWVDFKEVENKVGPYVSTVIQKAYQQNGYKSASEVLEDYKVFHYLLTKLTEGQNMLPVPTFAAEYFYREAQVVKAVMLGGFKAMLSDPTTNAKNKKWISEQLEKVDEPGELLENTKRSIRKFDARVEDLNQEVRDEISKQRAEKHKLKSLEKFQLVLNDFKASVRKFEKLKRIIFDEEKLLKSLAKRSSTYYETLLKVERTAFLRTTFFRLVRDDEVDLADQLNDVTKIMISSGLIIF